MPGYFPEGDVPNADDNETRSLQKINSLLYNQSLWYPAKQTIWIPARAMVARTTSGAAAGTSELATNKTMVATLDFDKDADEFAQFTVGMPKSWNQGTVTFRPVWTTADGDQDETVAWALQGKVVADHENLDANWGTAVVVSDTFETNDYAHIAAESGAVTLEGTSDHPTAAHFQIYRDISADNLGDDAKLIGVWVYYTVTGTTDA